MGTVLKITLHPPPISANVVDEEESEHSKRGRFRHMGVLKRPCSNGRYA